MLENRYHFFRAKAIIYSEIRTFIQYKPKRWSIFVVVDVLKGMMD